MPTLDKEIIEAAIDGLEAKKQHIERQLAELRAMRGRSATNSNAAVSTRKGTRRKLSPETIQHMREAQQRRWAKVNGAPASAKNVAAPKKKRRLSAAGRKAISEATKKRWAEKRAAAKA